MKKKILLMVAIVAMLVCLFAISASAAEPAYNDGEWIYAADGTTKLAIRDTEGNPLIWYMNGEELKYVRADQTDSTQSVYVKYDISGITSNTWGFGGVPAPTDKCLKGITIYDNGTEIYGNGPSNDLGRQKILLFNMERLDIEAIGACLFGNKNGCCPLMRGIVFPTTLKYIGQEGLTNTKLVQIWNLENTQLEYVNSCNWNTSTLTQEATNYTIKFPSTLTFPVNIQYTNVKIVIFSPNTTTGSANQTVRGCKSLEKMFIPNGFYETGFGAEVFRDTNNILIFFTGTEEQAELLKANSSDSHQGHFKNNAKLISYKTYLSDPTTYDNASGIYIVYDANCCEAFYDNEHDDIGNDCVIECSRCDDFDGEMKENPIHNYVNVIAYSNYLANGVKTQTCQNEGCVHKTTPNVVSVNPIISSFKGYSVKEDGNGITFGYTIDYAALDEFVKINGKKVDLGFVVAAQSKVTDNKLLNADGTVANANVIKASVVSWSNIDSENEETVKYNGADFKLTGDFTGLENTAICMAGYLFDGAVAYLNANASGEASDYITYGQLTNV